MGSPSAHGAGAAECGVWSLAGGGIEIPRPSRANDDPRCGHPCAGSCITIGSQAKWSVDSRTRRRTNLVILRSSKTNGPSFCLTMLTHASRGLVSARDVAGTYALCAGVVGFPRWVRARARYLGKDSVLRGKAMVNRKTFKYMNHI